MKQAFLSALIFLTSPDITASYAAGVSSEYEIKAAFLLNFPNFVDWPAEAFATPDAPLVICVFGGDPFSGALDVAANGKKIKGRRVLIRVTSDPQVLSSCHVVFVPASHLRAYGQMAKKRSGLNSLTVGETSDFIEHGGIINFLMQAGHIHFVINPLAAEKRHLLISSKLLNLAVGDGHRD